MFILSKSKVISQNCLCFLYAVLAQRGVFREKTFINYLKYLLYWKEPEYAKYLKYVAGRHINSTHPHRLTVDHWLFPVDSFTEETSLNVLVFLIFISSLLHRYPHCLHMLELLQYEHFRKELVNAQCAKFIDEQQLLHWQHYSRKRMRLQQALAEQQQPQQHPPPHGNATTK